MVAFQTESSHPRHLLDFHQTQLNRAPSPRSIRLSLRFFGVRLHRTILTPFLILWITHVLDFPGTKSFTSLLQFCPHLTQQLPLRGYWMGLALAQMILKHLPRGAASWQSPFQVHARALTSSSSISVIPRVPISDRLDTRFWISFFP